MSFVESLCEINWFSHAGEPYENARVVGGMQSGWDSVGNQMIDIWGNQSRSLEIQALRPLSDHEIDQIFAAVSDAIHDPLTKALCSYIDRTYRDISDEKRHQRTYDEAVYTEVLDAVKRDVCWAGVEYVLQVSGFFSTPLDLYRRGRWPCSWDGKHPLGRPVIL